MKFTKENTNFYHYLSGGFVLHQDEALRVSFRTISGELVESIGAMTRAELFSYDTGYTSAFLYPQQAGQRPPLRIDERFSGRFFAEIPIWERSPALLYLGNERQRDLFIAGYDKGRDHRLLNDR